MVFARGSLVRAMREIVRDPEVVGLTSYFENARDPAASLPDGVHFVGPDTASAVRLPVLRLPPRVLQHPDRVGAAQFHAVRRRGLPDLATRPRRGAQGWSRSSPARTSSSRFASTASSRQRGESYRIASLPDCVGVTEGPDTMRKLVAQRERWQRVILETCWANRRMLLNPRYGTVGMLGMPFYFLSEIVAPLFEILALVTLVGRTRLGARRLVGVRRRSRSRSRSATAPSRPARCSMQDLEQRDVPALARPALPGADAARAVRLPALHGVGAGEGHVAVPSRRQGLAQVRAQRPDGGDMSAPGARRTKDELLLLLVSGMATVVAVVFAVARRRRIRSLSGSRPRQHSRSRSRACSPSGSAARPADGSRSRSMPSRKPSATCCPRSPTGSCSCATARSARSTAASASCWATSARSSLGTRAPFPFWPPEHRHDVEAWHADLVARGELTSRAHVPAAPGRPRAAPRLGVRRRRPGRQPSPPPHRARRLHEPPPHAAAHRARGAGSRDGPPRPPGVRGASGRRRPPGDRRAGRT